MFSRWKDYQDQRKKRFEAVEEKGVEKGKAAVYQEIADWDRRRQQAEARGEPFTEPIPAPPEPPTAQ